MSARIMHTSTCGPLLLLAELRTLQGLSTGLPAAQTAQGTRATVFWGD